MTPKWSLFRHNLVIMDPGSLQPLAPLDPGKHPLFWGLLTFPHLDPLPGLNILPGIIFLYSWRGINRPQLTVKDKFIIREIAEIHKPCAPLWLYTLNCFSVIMHLKKMNVGRFTIFPSKMAFFKRVWQKVRVLSRPWDVGSKLPLIRPFIKGKLGSRTPDGSKNISSQVERTKSKSV